MRRFGIIGEIRIDHRRGGPVNAGMKYRRSHDDNLAQKFGDLRRLDDRQREVGDRSYRAERDLARVLFRHADDEIAGVLVGRPDLRLRKLDVADRIRAMNVIGAADVRVNERAPDAFGHGNVRPAQKLQHTQRIVRGDRGVGVAEGCGESLELYARPADSVENRHGVVDARVDIDYHSARAAHVEGLLARAQASDLERPSADLRHRRCQSNGSDLKRNMLAKPQAARGPQECATRFARTRSIASRVTGIGAQASITARG